MATVDDPTRERHLHCWKDQREHVEETYGWGSDEWVATWLDDAVGGTCILEAGHDGPHEFTPDDQIGVTFVGERHV